MLKRIGLIMLHVFVFPDLNSGVTYEIFFKILKSCSTLTFQIKIQMVASRHGISVRIIAFCLFLSLRLDYDNILFA